MNKLELMKRQTKSVKFLVLQKHSMRNSVTYSLKQRKRLTRQVKLLKMLKERISSFSVSSKTSNPLIPFRLINFYLTKQIVLMYNRNVN